MARRHLPREIIADILSRQPVKSLLRFRCVSKPWCALIDAPDFIKLHLTRSISNPSGSGSGSGHSLIVGGKGKLYSLDFDSLNSARKIETPFFKNSHFVELLGCCNGLLLLENDDGNALCLLNPFTRKFVMLPDTPIDYPCNCELGSTSSHVVYGLGYDLRNDDYKVVRVVEFSKKVTNEWISSETRVYSLKSNSWRRVRDFPYCVPRKRVWGAQVNGVFHSIVKQTWENPVRKVICGFDISSETFDLVEVPEFWDLSSCAITTEVLDGCLCLLGAYMGHRTDIWVMKEYGVKESWVKLLSVAPPVVAPYICVYPVAFSKGRDEVLLNVNEDKLIWYGLKGKSVRNVRVPGLPCSDYAEVCVESLVPLPSKRDGKARVIEKQNVEEEPKEKKTKKKRDDFLSKGFKLVL